MEAPHPSSRGYLGPALQTSGEAYGKSIVAAVNNLKALCIEEKNGLLERLLRELQQVENQIPPILTKAREEEIMIKLLALLSEPLSSPEMLTKCTVLFAERVEDGGREDLASRLANLVCDNDARLIARQSVVALINLFPVKPAFFTPFLSIMLEKLLAKITQSNGRDSFEVIKSIAEKAPAVIKSYNKNIEFIGNHFNSGVKLGKGKFGKVYKGYHVLTALPVAIKIIDWKHHSQNKQPAQIARAKKQLTNEIAIMKKVAHVNAVELYEVVQVQHRIYIIMEFVAGGDLSTYLRKKRCLPEKEVQRWLQHLAAGMKSLRENNILHRDLKPENLLLSMPNENGILKITDFGLGRFLGPGELAETHVGTPLYMAPEVFKPTPFTEKCDLWSIGVITYEMLIGELPYKGNNLSQLLHNISYLSLSFPSSIPISDELRSVICSLLQKDPEKRISWNDFFLHPYVTPPPPRPVSPFLRPQMHSGINPLELIQDLQNRLDEKQAEIVKLQDKMSEWEHDKARQFERLKDIFEKDNDELRAKIEELEEQLKDKEHSQKLIEENEQNVTIELSLLEKQNQHMKKSMEEQQHLIQKQQEMIKQYELEKVKRSREEKKRSKEEKEKLEHEKAKQRQGFKLKLNEICEAVDRERTLKIRTNIVSKYRTNTKYKCVVWMMEFLGEGNVLRLHFDSIGDGSLGSVQHAIKSRVVMVNGLGRMEDSASDHSPVLFSSSLQINEKNRVLGHLDFIVPAGFCQNMSYFFVYGHTGYSRALLFEL